MNGSRLLALGCAVAAFGCAQDEQDEGRIAFAAVTGREPAALLILDVATGQATEVARGAPQDFNALAWNGNRIAFHAYPTAVQNWRLFDIDPSGADRRPLHEPAAGDRTSQYFPVFSPQGRIAYYEVIPFQFSGHAVDGRPIGPHGEHTRAAWSADGRELAVSTRAGVPDAGLGYSSIQAFDVAALPAKSARDLYRTTVLERLCLDPVYSPDGRWLAFSVAVFASLQVTQPTTQEIWVVGADGREARALTTGARDEYPTWSPDSRRLAFARRTPAGMRLFAVDRDGSGLRQLHDGEARYPAWSR